MGSTRGVYTLLFAHPNVVDATTKWLACARIFLEPRKFLRADFGHRTQILPKFRASHIAQRPQICRHFVSRSTDRKASLVPRAREADQTRPTEYLERGVAPGNALAVKGREWGGSTIECRIES